MKRIMVALIILSMAGVVMATAGKRWWNSGRVAAAAGHIDGDGAGQPAAAVEFRKLYAQYRGQDSLSDIAGTIRIYDGENNNALKETKPFRTIRSGRQSYSLLSYLQTWCNGAVLLRLDTVNRQIWVSRPAGDEAAKGQELIGRYFNDTAALKISGKVSGGPGTMRVLRIKSELNPSLRSCTFYYDTVSYRLRTIDIEWRKPGAGQEVDSTKKIWLSTIDFQYRIARPMDMNKEMAKIISITDGTVRPTAAYREYAIYGNLN